MAMQRQQQSSILPRSSSPVSAVLVVLIFLQCCCFDSKSSCVTALTEEERLAGYRARNYTWPPSQHWIPDTPAWRAVMNRRLKQTDAMPLTEERFSSFVVLLTSGLMGQNLTKYGWGLTRIQSEGIRELQEALHTQEWSNVENLEGLKVMGMRHYGEGPIFLDTEETNFKILKELKDLHQDWVGGGIQLQPQVAYGLRVYRNQSQLLMHIDNPTTHVVSSILHIGHSEDAADWPLLLQDYEGNTVEVHMEPGDLLFYESSRILHGRPSVLNGTWYSSLFIHYLPVGYWEPGHQTTDEMHYMVPPHWGNEPTEEAIAAAEGLPPLSTYGYGLEERSCAPSNWCDIGERIVIRGPATEGIIQSSGSRRFLPRRDSLRDEL